jgi:hypothetical protein
LNGGAQVWWSASLPASRFQNEDRMKIRPLKPDRTKIDLTDDVLARGWAKKLGKSKEEIATAIAKVGDNAETVKKELGGSSIQE